MFEIVIGVGIIVLALVGLIGGLRLFASAGLASAESAKAHFLLEEGFEALRSMRDADYSTNIGARIGGGTYYFTFSGGQWDLTATAATIDNIFERTMVLSNVLRDANDDIAATGTTDPDTAEATITVTWPSGGVTRTESVTGYITNLFN